MAIKVGEFAIRPLTFNNNAEMRGDWRNTIAVFDYTVEPGWSFEFHELRFVITDGGAHNADNRFGNMGILPPPGMKFELLDATSSPTTDFLGGNPIIRNADFARLGGRSFDLGNRRGFAHTFEPRRCVGEAIKIPSGGSLAVTVENVNLNPLVSLTATAFGVRVAG